MKDTTQKEHRLARDPLLGLPFPFVNFREVSANDDRCKIKSDEPNEDSDITVLVAVVITKWLVLRAKGSR
jgi:hypothetical protein